MPATAEFHAGCGVRAPEINWVYHIVFCGFIITSVCVPGRWFTTSPSIGWPSTVTDLMPCTHHRILHGNIFRNLRFTLKPSSLPDTRIDFRPSYEGLMPSMNCVMAYHIQAAVPVSQLFAFTGRRRPCRPPSGSIHKVRTLQGTCSSVRHILRNTPRNGHPVPVRI